MLQAVYSTKYTELNMLLLVYLTFSKGKTHLINFKKKKKNIKDWKLLYSNNIFSTDELMILIVEFVKTISQDKVFYWNIYKFSEETP